MRHEELIEPDLRGVIIVPEPITDEEFDAAVQKLSEELKSDLLTYLFAGTVTTYSYEEGGNEA